MVAGPRRSISVRHKSVGCLSLTCEVAKFTERSEGLSSPVYPSLILYHLYIGIHEVFFLGLIDFSRRLCKDLYVGSDEPLCCFFHYIPVIIIIIIIIIIHIITLVLWWFKVGDSVECNDKGKQYNDSNRGPMYQPGEWFVGDFCTSSTIFLKSSREENCC